MKKLYLGSSKPIIHFSTFKRYHEDLDARLRNLSTTPRGRCKLSKDAVEYSTRRSQIYLPASNLPVRIIVVEELVREYKRYRSELDPGECFFVTIVPEGFTTPLVEHRQMDLRKLKAVIDQALFGLGYIGAVDLAAYVDLRWEAGCPDIVVSPHVHLVVWGCTEMHMKAMVWKLNKENEPLLRGFKPAHYKTLSKVECMQRLHYMLKFPMKEYQVWQTTKPGIVPGVRVKTGRWKQDKKPIRPGIAARLATKLAPFGMSDILFGSGDGSKIIHVALRKARRRILRDRQVATERRVRTVFGRQVAARICPQ